jgi:hypothetical protein
MADERTSRVAELLSKTESAHGTYESEELGGERDEQWARWYAEHLVQGKLPDVLGSAPSAEQVAAVLTEATDDLESEGSDADWSEFAAARVVERLG